MRSTQTHTDHHFIGSRWAPADESRDPLAVVSPATEEEIARVPEPSAAQADEAVRVARTSFDTGVWRSVPVFERIEKMLELARLYEKTIETMARTLTSEMGASITWTTNAQALGSLSLIRTLAHEAESYPWEETKLDGAATIIREPAGVVVAIPPWNVPQSTTLSKIVPALISGCSVVAKPSPETPLDALLLAELIAEIDLPEGVVSILPAGRAIGERLVSNNDVDHVAFTGSTSAGKAIASLCTKRLARFTLELGGKSAAIICEDADLETTMAGLRTASFNVSGQACIAQTRILAPRSRYSEVVDALESLARSLRVGDPFDPSTEVGPLVTAAHRDRVRNYIQIGRDEGAKLVAGGSRPPSGCDRGWYVSPTVFSGVDNRMRIAQEEIFGPVLCVIPYEDETEAVRIANDSRYGLSGSVWTMNAERGASIARQVRTGMIGINAFRPHFSMPFGGFKESGIGREFGREGFDAYTESKSFFHPAPVA